MSKNIRIFSLFLCLVLFPAFMLAQKHIAIQTEKMNVVYANSVDNPLTFAVDGIPDSCLTLTPSVGKLEPMNGRSKVYFTWIIADLETNAATLTIRDICADSLLKVVEYRVKQIPEPESMAGVGEETSYARVGHGPSRSNRISLLSHYDFDFYPRCEALSYELWYVHNHELRFIENIGPYFNKEILHIVENAQKGDAFHFKNIRYRCGCGAERFLTQDLYYQMK